LITKNQNNNLNSLEGVDLLQGNNYFSLTGSDEVGRGPLAGPVVACSVTLRLKDKSALTLQCFKEVLNVLLKSGINDSKKLSEKKRELVLKNLNLKNFLDQNLRLDFCHENFNLDYQNLNLDFCFDELDNLKLNNKFIIDFTISGLNSSTIDKINILQASLQAMTNSYESLNEAHKSNLWLIDGSHSPKTSLWNTKTVPIIKGDSKNILIALGSIIAKYFRDKLMTILSESYPEYEFEKHSGYPTVKHKYAIEKYGPCSYHRKSFKGVKEYIL
jgi:ribonuclease HII